MRRLIKTVVLLEAILCVLAATGCADKRVDLVDAGKVSLEVAEPSQVHIWGVTVRQGPRDACVSGQVHRDGFIGEPLRGHVDVEVIQADGDLVKRMEAPLSMLRGNRISRPGSFFHAHIPGRLPAGSAVRVRYHPGDHSQDNQG